MSSLVARIVRPLKPGQLAQSLCKCLRRPVPLRGRYHTPWALGPLGLVAACGLEATPEAGTGSLTLALTSQAAGVSYRLVDARFALEGPESKGFASSEEDDVNVELLPGSYTLELLPGYRLVRTDDDARNPVQASLLSENPAPLLVEAGTTTEVALQFELADGTQVSNQRGTVSVGLDLGTAEGDAGATAQCVDGLRIDELDYDEVSADDHEFVELVNTAACQATLKGVVLELVNGSDGKVYASYPLEQAAESLASQGRLVVGDSAVLAALPAGTPRITLKSLGVQNGPDGLRLMLGGRRLDGLAYEGPTADTGEGRPVGADDAELAFGRCPTGFDSDDNQLDFQLRQPTPGAANRCE
jgi:hypothetical protein